MTGPHPIPCDQVVIRLWEYIDGELNEQGAADVARHLELCQRCFPHYDFQRSYVEFLRRTSQCGAPPAVRRRIFEAILEEKAGTPQDDSDPSLGGRIRSVLRSFLGGE